MRSFDRDSTNMHEICLGMFKFRVSVSDIAMTWCIVKIDPVEMLEISSNKISILNLSMQ